MPPVIETHDLTRRFGDLVAVDHVNFGVEQGEVLGFLGPNGAGKTTTVRMLTGVIDPTEGTASIQGHDIRRESLLARQHLGIVPEEANVYPDLTVWQNLMLMAELHAMPRRERVREGDRLLGLLGLADRRKQKARALSKGLRQRLMLCTALISRPDILFLDEPTSGLDVASARLIRQIVTQLNSERGLTVFLTTHNMDEAQDLCARVAIINEGRIAAVDTPEQLRTVVRCRQFVEVTFENAAPTPPELGALPGVTEAAQSQGGWRLFCESPGEVAAEVVRLADAKGAKLAALNTRKPSLEDVFLYFTSGAEEKAHGE